VVLDMWEVVVLEVELWIALLLAGVWCMVVLDAMEEQLFLTSWRLLPNILILLPVNMAVVEVAGTLIKSRVLLVAQLQLMRVLALRMVVVEVVVLVLD